MAIDKTDLNSSELAGRNSAGDNNQRAFMQRPMADSRLPSPPDDSSGLVGGTALFELESYIRKQLETSAQGVRSVNDTRNKICGTAQDPQEIDLLAVISGHKAR